MKKLLVTTAITLTTTLFLTAGHAGNNGHGHGYGHGKWEQANHRRGKSKRNRGGKGGSAVISYDIDPGTCAVTVSSTKSLSNIVLKDSSGKTIKKWDNLSGKSFSDFGMYNAILADGSLYIKSGNNGKRGKRNRGLGAEIGGDFRTDLESCLTTTPLADCPFESQIDDVRDAAGGNANLDVFDNEKSCEFFFNTQAISVVNNTDGTGYVGVSYFRDTCTAIGTPGTVDKCADFVDGTLEPAEAQACVDHMSLCSTEIK